MAEIAAVYTDPKRDSENVRLIQWTPVTEADTFEAIELPGFTVRSVQVAGTFGSSTTLIQGSNDGTNYETLHDQQGNALSFAAKGLKGIEEISRYLKPSTSGGTSQSLTVTVCFVRRGR